MNFKLATIAISITLTGCITSNVTPKSAWNKSLENKELIKFVEQDHVNQYLESKEQRKYLIKLATAKIYLIDESYLNFKNSLKKHKGLAFGSAASSQLFTTAATLFTPVSTKNLLTASATSINGLQGSFDKHLLAEKSIEAIINQMDAQRAIVYKNIRDNLSDPNYTLIDLNRHLDMYYDAGTIEAAMREISNTTAKNNSEAQNELITTIEYGATENTETIRNWIKGTDGKNDQIKVQKLKSWLNKQSDEIKVKLKPDDIGLVPRFLNGPYKDLRSNFIKEVINYHN